MHLIWEIKIEKKWKKRQTFDPGYDVGRSYFTDDG